MSKMTCLNHKDAEFVCTSLICESKCAYACNDPQCTCREQHQSCSITTITYLQRKSSKMHSKSKQLCIQKIGPLYEIGSKLWKQLEHFMQALNLLSEIKEIIDPHGLLGIDQKKKIQEFLTNSALKQSTQISLSKIEKDLIGFHLQISNYLQFIKDQKIKEDEDRIRRQHLNDRKKSRVVNSSGEKDKEGSNSKFKIIANPSPVKSGLKEMVGSNIFEPKSSVLASNVAKSKVRDKYQNLIHLGNNNTQFEEIIASSMKSKHVPKGPLYSKITNDTQTINTFFYNKFTDAKLLYRASENDFLVNKFHQKCNDATNTLTIIWTEFDKIIGGFTPLPWKSGGGQWYQDSHEASFLFNLSSGERYPLYNKLKAIWCSQAFGPSFGQPDLQIADKANSNSNSCANFPQCYNNGNYTSGTGSTQMFCGTKTGHFRIREWEVYELIF